MLKNSVLKAKTKTEKILFFFFCHYQYLQLVIALTECKGSHLPKRTFYYYYLARSGIGMSILCPSHPESSEEGPPAERLVENMPEQ